VVEHVFIMSGGQTEPSSRLDDRCSREPDHHHGYPAL